MLAFAEQKLVASLLYRVTLGNPGVLLLSILVLLWATLVAAMIPIGRATHINPTESLRSEEMVPSLGTDCLPFFIRAGRDLREGPSVPSALT